MELLLVVKKKYELYLVLKKINNYISTKEFSEDKFMQFKEILLLYLENLLTQSPDKILVPFIFNLLKKSFFKIKDVNKNRSSRKFIKAEKNNIPIIDEKNSDMIMRSLTIAFKYMKLDLMEDITLSALNYVMKNFEPPEIVAIIFSGMVTKIDEYILQEIIMNKYYIIFSDILLKYHEYQACVQPICVIILRVLKQKKEDTSDLTKILTSLKYKDVLKKIIKIHDCNTAIICNILGIIFNIIDNIDIDNLLQIISIQRLREIFNIFKMNGFDQIHEVIISLLKQILTKKIEQSKNINMNIRSSLDSMRDGSSTISDEDFVEIIIISSLSFQFMRNKVLLLDFMKLARYVHILMNHMYLICQMILNYNQRVLTKQISLFLEKKITEWLIEVIYTVNERNVFIGLDAAFQQGEVSLIITKVTIFRNLYHCLNLIKTLKDIHPSTLVIYFNSE